LAKLIQKSDKQRFAEYKWYIWRDFNVAFGGKMMWHLAYRILLLIDNADVFNPDF